MIYKKSAILLAILLILLFLPSCGKDSVDSIDPTNTGSPDEISLRFRITWQDYSGRGEAIQSIVHSYNAQNDDGCAVSMIGGDEDISAIQTLLGSNSDTIFVLPYRYVKYFGELGLLADMTDLFEDEKPLFYPNLWQLGTVGGTTYGIPWLGHSMCLLYNQSLLKTAGVDPASINSLNGLLGAIERVEEKTDANGIGLVGAESNDVSWMVNQFIYGFGSQLVSDDGTTVAINNETSRSALAFYRDVLGKHAQPTWVTDTGAEVMTHFRNQEIAFEIQGIWGVTDIQKNGSPFDVGIISLDEIGLRAEVGPMMLAVPATMSDSAKEQAVSFIRYMISTDAQEQIMNGEYSPEHDMYYPFRTPIRIDMADSDVMKSYPGYAKFIEGFQNPSIDVPVPAWQSIKDELYAPGLHQVMQNAITIDAFLNNLETKGSEILNKSK